MTGMLPTGHDAPVNAGSGDQQIRPPKSKTPTIIQWWGLAQ